MVGGMVQEREGGYRDTGITAQLTPVSTLFHEDPRASQDEALPLSAPTGGMTWWAPAPRVLVEVPARPLMRDAD